MKNIMKHIRTYNENNDYHLDFDSNLDEIDGNIAQPYVEPEPELEIDGNKYIPPKGNGDEETGTVKKFFKDKGYGFITGDDGENYFTNTYHLIDKIKIGDKVKFIIKKTNKSPKATKVTLI